MKVKDSEITKRYPLCLGNISKDFTANNMKKTGLNRYIHKLIIDCWYNMSVDCNIVDTSNIIDNHKCSMKIYNIK